MSYIDFLNSNPKPHAYLLDNLAYVNFLPGDTDNLPADFLLPLAVREHINDQVGISINYLHLAIYYQFLNNNHLAKTYAEKTKEIS